MLRADPRSASRRLRALASCAGAALALAGCSLAPKYAPPPVSAPVAYKETGPWTPASPADAASRGAWWAVFGDATLNGLEQKVDQANPDLAAALARHEQARTYLTQARAALLPEIDGVASETSNQVSLHKPMIPLMRKLGGAGFTNHYDDDIAGYQASYEVDLWGHVRNEVAAQKANVQASAADVANVRLSLEADLADAYMNLRGLDVQAKLLADTVQAYARALQLTQDQHDGGAASGLDVDRAKAQLQSARAQAVDVAAQRALYEHAIASLVGENASTFSLAKSTAMPVQPRVPVSAPSELLQRRPDIAAAERLTAAANAEIGVARAAFYPTVTLNAGQGFEDMGGMSLLAPSNAFWAVGPSVTLPLFDAGRRSAAVKRARAQFDEASANYRSTVLAAFQQVEDNLALNNKLADEAREQAGAVDAANKAEDIATTQYRMGEVTYLDVVVAQTADLEAQRMDITIATRRLLAGVDLIRALGGGWTVQQAA